MNYISSIFVTLFYIGKSPIAPGTLGSIAGILIWACLNYYLGLIGFIIFFIVYFIVSYILVNIYINKTKQDDPSEVICDEVIGQFIPLLIIGSINEYYLIIFSFILFRFFDIYKIYPVNKAEKLHGAFGVILDDVVAGIYALIFLFIIKYSIY
jgi:phosphatidylglycerophosphatase A|tara:strand:+ start:1285 stop:1743 length:459 start_codon:yes stop_codon:yes gene_type:complete